MKCSLQILDYNPIYPHLVVADIPVKTLETTYDNRLNRVNIVCVTSTNRRLHKMWQILLCEIQVRQTVYQNRQLCMPQSPDWKVYWFDEFWRVSTFLLTM